MSYKIIELEQGSAPWLAFRKNHITATDSGIILGLNPWKTPYQLWEEKLGLREPEPENDKMREGTLLEEKARRFINEKCHFNNFRPVVLQSTIYPFMMASLDGFDDNKAGPIPRILEIKCGKNSHELALKNEIPSYYMAQLQKQIFVTQLPKISYLSYRSDEDTYEITVQRDDAFIEKMIEAEKEFFKMLMDFTPPPLTDRDYVINDSGELFFKLTRLNDFKRSVKNISSEIDELEKEITEHCQGKSTKCGNFKITKVIRKGAIDYSGIELLKDVNLDAYRKKSTEYFRISENE